MGELYPGGPVTLPTRVRVADTTIEAQFLPAATIAYYAATSRWAELADRMFPLDEGLRARLTDPNDDFDTRDLSKAALLLTIRLSGAGPDISGWRVMMHMAGVIVRDWLEVAGRLAVLGVDVETAQFWRVVASVRHIVSDGATPEYRAWLERTLEYPLPLEPACVEGAGSLSAVRSRAAADFAELQREIGGD